jgi:hypothetical protein
MKVPINEVLKAFVELPVQAVLQAETEVSK